MLHKNTDSLSSFVIEALNVCPECKGTGILVIYNAYDPDFRQEEACHFCDGGGKKGDKSTRVYH